MGGVTIPLAANQLERHQTDALGDYGKAVALQGLLANQKQQQILRPLEVQQQQAQVQAAQQAQQEQAIKLKQAQDDEIDDKRMNDLWLANGGDLNKVKAALPTAGVSLRGVQRWTQKEAAVGESINKMDAEHFKAVKEANAQLGPITKSILDAPPEDQAAMYALSVNRIKRDPTLAKYAQDLPPTYPGPEVLQQHLAGMQTFEQLAKGREDKLAQEKFQFDQTRERRNPTEASLALSAAQNPGGDEDKALRRLDQSRLASRPVVNNIIPGMPGAASTTGKSGDEFLSTLPAGIANQVQAIAEGRATLPSGSSRSQAAQQLRQAVFQYDPSYSDQRAQVRKAFTTGSDGRNIGALNTASVHLDTLGEVAKGLANGSMQPGNQLKNALTATFGGSAPTNFEGVKDAVAGEMASALKGNATDIEIEKISKSIQSKNSPAQLADYIDNQLHILHQKLDTYQQRYQQQIPGDKTWSPILPQANAVFQKHGAAPSSSQPQSDFFSQFGGKPR